MAMSIGWNPYFNNSEKTIVSAMLTYRMSLNTIFNVLILKLQEPWLLHEFDGDFYGEELRLVIVGYIRPETNFPSLESLVGKIHGDGRIAEKALDLPLYSKFRDDPHLKGSAS
uniref:riboflavin kinase n=1 Tax=Rhizophora mucronata TaxID=61149 RepID=A0A2P2M3U7_RHIMU